MTNIVIERSHRHVHLTERTARHLFGSGPLINVNSLKPLSVLGEYATDLFVEFPVIGRTRVLYPWRAHNQLEVSMSEYRRMMGHYTTRRASGDVLDAEKVYTSGPTITEIPIIVPKAHAHAPAMCVPTVLREFPLDLDVKVHDTIDGKAYVHLDNDQFNAVQGGAVKFPVQWHF